ncbi:hypothetical protein BN1708_020635, partial [Verticillium longisporum]
AADGEIRQGHLRLPHDDCRAQEVGEGVQEGRLRPVLLPLRGRPLLRRREPRDDLRQEDVPEGVDQVHSSAGHARRYRPEARNLGR